MLRWDSSFEEQKEIPKNRKIKNSKRAQSTVRENEDLKDPFSPNPKKSPQNPPPGFSPLNTIVEEAAEKRINLQNDSNLDVSNDLNMSNTVTPDISFMDNLQQNSYPNFGANTTNMFGPNGLTTDAVATKIELEIMKIQTINNLTTLLNQVPPDGASKIFLQGKIDTLMKELKEVQLCSAQLMNSNMQTPNFQNLSSQINTPSPTDFVQWTSSATLTPQSSNLSVNSCNSLGSRAGTGTLPSSYPCNNLQNTNQSTARVEKIDENQNFWDLKKPEVDSSNRFSDDMDNFIKKASKISENTNTLNNTNPFKTSFEENNQNRSSLHSFYENPPRIPDRDPNFINKSNIEYFKTSNISKETKSGVSTFDKEDRSFNIQNPMVHNFDPVVSSSTVQENHGSKVVYEAGPVIYNVKESEKKTDNNIYDKSHWKPIPPANEPSRCSEFQAINIPSFNIRKPKNSLTEGLGELRKLNVEVDSRSNVMDKNSRDIITPTDFKTSTIRQNAHILIPGKLTNNVQEKVQINYDDKDEVSNCSQQDYCQVRARTPPAQISVSAMNKIPNGRTEILATVFEDRSLIGNKPGSKKKESVATPFMNGEVVDQTECSPANIASSLKSTNPFIQDIAFANSNQEIEQELNKVTKNLEASKLTETVEESRTEKKVYTPSFKDDSSVCFLYQLSSKEMSIIVINMENEGWLCTDEFVAAFTTLIGGGSVLLSVLEMINLKVPFRTVDRSTHPSLMTELDFSPLRVQRDSQNRICRQVHLTPLKSTLRILTKIKVIKREDMNAAITNKQYKEGTILSDMMKMISSYGTFMRTKCKS